MHILADLYIPFFVGFLFCVWWVLGKSHGWRKLWPDVFCFLITLFVVYGLMVLDAIFFIWGRFDLDYSTHSALAFGLLGFLIIYLSKWWVLFVLSFFGYAWLMVLLDYHLWADVFTTVIACAFFMLPCWLWMYFFKPELRFRS